MSATLCRHLCCFVRTRSENDVTGTIGNSDSSGLLHPTLPNADRLLFSLCTDAPSAPLRGRGVCTQVIYSLVPLKVEKY